MPDYAFSSEPTADLIVVPGGPGTRDEASAAPVQAWLAARRETPLITSVCTGAFLLGAAGLLDGRRATTHHRWFDLFAERFPDVELVRDSRVVDDGAIVTAGGVTSGIDLGLYLVARLLGDDVSAEVASVMEYSSPNTHGSERRTCYLRQELELLQQPSRLDRWIEDHVLGTGVDVLGQPLGAARGRARKAVALDRMGRERRSVPAREIEPHVLDRAAD